MEKEAEKIKVLYSRLAQVLDGLWFLEVEKRFGFDKAYEIDEAVWKSFTPKEVYRLKKFLEIDKPMVEDVKKILSLSIFNSTLTYDIEDISNGENKTIGLRFIVRKCKTLQGMKNVGRAPEQITKICKGIGLAFYEPMMKGLFPDSTVNCVSCPYYEKNDSETDDSQHCTWEFYFNLE